jgi:hypothetical protein
MSAAYTAYRLAPQTVVQPLFLVGEMIAPALIGLSVFAEREGLRSRARWHRRGGPHGAPPQPLCYGGRGGKADG